MMIQNKDKGISVLIGLAILIKIALHLISDSVSGFLGDEFLHIDTGNHLAFGYSDYPPMIGGIAWLQNLFQSESTIVNRLFVHLAGIAIMLITAYVIIQLGGKRKAIVLAMLAFLISPLIAVSHTLFLPMGFNQFFHVISVLFLFLYYRDNKDKYLYFLAISLGLGALTKYTIGVFIASIFISVLIFDRKIFKKRSFWIAAVIFIVVISPNLLWQINNDFPAIEHFMALSKLDLSHTSFSEMLMLLFTYINPFTFFICAAGVIVLLFASSLKKFKIIGISIFLTVTIILAIGGKFYYIMPAMIAGIPFGSVIMEKWLNNKKLLFASLSVIMVVSGVFIVPLGMPFFSPDRFVKLYNIKPAEDGRIPIYLDHFHTKKLWSDVVEGVNEVYKNLPEQEQQNCLIWGRHYSYAALINLYKKDYELPEAISLMGCYHNWLPDFGKDKLFIAAGEYNLGERFWHRYFDSVEEKKSYRDMYSKDFQNSGIRIFICKGLKYNSRELKLLINKYGLGEDSN
jgi:MFS family permease